MREVFNEITHLEPLDVFYVGERYKNYFDYPAHCHEEYELNFVENAAGVVRTIGDSNRLFCESKGCTPSEFRERF